MENATLMVGSDARRWTRDQLAVIPTPERTKTWLPVPHHDLVQGLVAALEARGIMIVGEDYCTKGKAQELLLGVLDLRIPGLDRPDVHLGMAIKAGNDRKNQARALVAGRVSCCSNLMMSGSGDAVCLARKHTSGFDLQRFIPRALDSFLEKAVSFQGQIDRMQEILLEDARAKELLWDAFHGKRRVAPLFLSDKVGHLYFDSEEQRAMFPERSVWSLSNAFTQAVKELKPAPQFQAGLNIGRFISVLVNGETMQAQLELPLAEQVEELVEREIEREIEREPEPEMDPEELQNFDDAQWDIASNW